MQIKRAGKDDLATLLRFQQGVVSAERAFDPTLRAGAIEYYDIAAMLQDDAVHFLLAHIEGMPVGCGFARIERAKPFLKHAHRGYLGLMYVEPQFRGRGINAAIIGELKAWCRGRRVTELRLEVYQANAAAIGAYAKAGFTPHMLEMRMDVAASSVDSATK